MAKPRRGDLLELTIDDLAFGGEGVGRVNGYVMFVRGAIPGDRLRVRVTETRARYGRGVIEAIESPSPQRVAAPCPYFGRCGGGRRAPRPLRAAPGLQGKERGGPPRPGGARPRAPPRPPPAAPPQARRRHT